MRSGEIRPRRGERLRDTMDRLRLRPDLDVRAAGGTRQDRLATLDIGGFPLQHHWYFVCPSGKQVSLVARAFMDFVRTEAKQLGFDRLPRTNVEPRLAYSMQS